MVDIKKRQDRYDSKNLVAYTSVDDHGQVVKQGMGRTLNVSEGGILLETYKPVDPAYAVLLSIGLADNVVEIRARVVYNRIIEDGLFACGLSFQEIDRDSLPVLNDFIRVFQEQNGEKGETPA